MTHEINNKYWRNISGYLNYQVTNVGRIRNSNTGRILKPAKDGHGYLYVVLSVKRITKSYKIHRQSRRETLC